MYGHGFLTSDYVKIIIHNEIPFQFWKKKCMFK